jgi:hypothetical protein
MTKKLEYSHKSKKDRTRRLNRERMIKFRAKNSIKKGRKSGKRGRPVILFDYERHCVLSKIHKDSLGGVFHHLLWLLELVEDLYSVRGVDNFVPSRSWAYKFINTGVFQYLVKNSFFFIINVFFSNIFA